MKTHKNGSLVYCYIRTYGVWKWTDVHVYNATNINEVSTSTFLWISEVFIVLKTPKNNWIGI